LFNNNSGTELYNIVLGVVALEGETEIRLRVRQNGGLAARHGHKTAVKPKLLRYIGPAFVVSVAYIDPGNKIIRPIIKPIYKYTKI
jgi:hypothetical protein